MAALADGSVRFSLCVQIREAETLYPADAIVPSGDAAAGGAMSATPSKRGAAAVTTAPATPAAPAAPGTAKGGLQLSAGWRQDPAGRDDISTAGYVGLRNLGCICYMNSLMQQFFMIEPFRYGILSVPLGETLTEEDRKESTMYQLQRLFGHLELSERRHYDPTPWCHAYKGYDGRPTNTLVQQDAQVGPATAGCTFWRSPSNLAPTRRRCCRSTSARCSTASSWGCAPRREPNSSIRCVSAAAAAAAAAARRSTASLYSRCCRRFSP